MKNFLLLVCLLATNTSVNSSISTSVGYVESYLTEAIISEVVTEPDIKLVKPKISVSEKAFIFIKGWEGFSDEPYQCIAGHWTIGYGTLYKKKMDLPISENIAKSLALKQIKYLEEKIPTIVDITLTDEQLVSLISFSYNLGFYSLKRSTLLKSINSCKDDKVKKEFVRWNKIKSTETGEKIPVKGLTLRRQAELTLWMKNAE